MQVGVIPATGAAEYVFPDAGLTPGLQYRYGVRAYAGSQQSDLVTASGRPS